MYDQAPTAILAQKPSAVATLQAQEDLAMAKMQAKLDMEEAQVGSEVGTAHSGWFILMVVVLILQLLESKADNELLRYQNSGMRHALEETRIAPPSTTIGTHRRTHSPSL